MSCEKLYVQLAIPDEVGNAHFWEAAGGKGINPYSDSFDEASFPAAFATIPASFTGVDYIIL